MKKRFIGAIVLVISLLLAVVAVASSIEPRGTECGHYGVADALVTTESIKDFQYTDTCCYKLYTRETRRCVVCGNVWGIITSYVGDVSHRFESELTIDEICVECGYMK
ncbi:MAG: hypothetical protein IJW77_16055 [Clostridia bacterium]|nr:hypothetical protein [Clostridia bacterium]